MCGSSAGSVIAALYGGGLCPSTSLPELLFRIRRADILTPFWFAPSCFWKGGFAVINQPFLRRHAPATRLEHSASCPVFISTYDTVAGRTIVHREGDTAAVVAASCAIPRLFQPVQLCGVPHVDGGYDDLLALASCSRTERVLSIDLHTQGLEGPRGRMLAQMDAARRARGGRLDGCTRLQFRGVPFVGPTTMATAGPIAYEAGRQAMREALMLRRAQWGGEAIVAVAVEGGGAGKGALDGASARASLG